MSRGRNSCDINAFTGLLTLILIILTKCQSLTYLNLNFTPKPLKESDELKAQCSVPATAVSD